MHGVRRQKKQTDLSQDQRQKEQTKIRDYRSVVDDLLERNQNDVYDQISFDLTTKALQLNPELYTAWNYRRKILLRGLFPNSTQVTVHNLLLSDLNMTTVFLKSFPKVYWIWTHRRWCLDNIPSGPGGSEDGKEDITWRREAWERELMLVEKMLSMDARNYHAWNYRRLALSFLPPDSVVPHSRDSELAYTKKKIEANFSNFSAWHQRTKFMGSGPFVGGEKEMAAEFDLVNQALWTDPADQSSWLYHRFLISKTNNEPDIIRREMTLLRDLHDLEPEAKWPMDTLVYYASILIHSSSTDVEERVRLKSDAEGWLDRLEVVDEGRKERYRAIKTGLN
ncbi:Protein geranylgeranyltransferase type II, alpha subunit [Phaffia rhodozyma]|uniref:Geranylgeranyl transferase type-2 subunit alpha n=1 Tax=Phaffia rhodozyma TaxID=264483 RepID=A0A0F7SRS4_PHARH|nr:Protein geranylgeranyltransferase type II, alpha subunit [Phaffia rhodozyma]